MEGGREGDHGGGGGAAASQDDPARPLKRPAAALESAGDPEGGEAGVRLGGAPTSGSTLHGGANTSSAPKRREVHVDSAAGTAAHTQSNPVASAASAASAAQPSASGGGQPPARRRTVLAMFEDLREQQLVDLLRLVCPASSPPTTTPPPPHSPIHAPASLRPTRTVFIAASCSAAFISLRASVVASTRHTRWSCAHGAGHGTLGIVWMSFYPANLPWIHPSVCAVTGSLSRLRKRVEWAEVEPRWT